MSGATGAPTPGAPVTPPSTRSTPRNFSDLEQAWLWRGDNFGPSPRLHPSLDPDLCRWEAVHRRRPESHGLGPGSGHRRSALDVPGAAHDPLGAVFAKEPRQGCGVPRGRGTRCDLLGDAGLLPSRVGRRDGPSARGVRRARTARRLRRDRARWIFSRPWGTRTIPTTASRIRSATSRTRPLRSW